MPEPTLESLRATTKPLRISVTHGTRGLEAIEFGAMASYRPDEHYVEVGESFRYVLRSPRGPAIGFQLMDLDEFDIDEAAPEIWDGPRFDVPPLGLTKATAGEIVLATRGTLTDCCTADNIFFAMAVDAAGEDHDDLAQSAVHWRSCLETGEMRAHYGLGYTYVGLGDLHRAYAHLRTYVGLAPRDAWGWTWLGKACEGRGDIPEARRAYRRALRLEREGGDETDAAECLEELRGR